MFSNMSVNMSGGAYPTGGGGMDGMGGMGGMEEPGKIMQLLNSLDPWIRNLIITAAVLLAAILVGYIVGKLYGWVRYPDPEKHGVLTAVQKIIAIVVVVVGVSFLYYTISKPEPDPTLPVDGDMSASMPEGEQPQGMDNEAGEESGEPPEEEGPEGENGGEIPQPDAEPAPAPAVNEAPGGAAATTHGDIAVG